MSSLPQTQAGQARTALSQAWAQERCLGPHSENKGTAVFKPEDNPSNKAHTLTGKSSERLGADTQVRAPEANTTCLSTGV